MESVGNVFLTEQKAREKQKKAKTTSFMSKFLLDLALFLPHFVELLNGCVFT